MSALIGRSLAALGLVAALAGTAAAQDTRQTVEEMQRRFERLRFTPQQPREARLSNGVRVLMLEDHALPQLHELIKHDLPAPNQSILEGYREMIPAFLRQLRNEDYFLERALPPTAKPYRAELHELSVAAA